jgi:hypothetical protein
MKIKFLADENLRQAISRLVEWHAEGKAEIRKSKLEDRGEFRISIFEFRQSPIGREFLREPSGAQGVFGSHTHRKPKKSDRASGLML